MKQLDVLIIEDSIFWADLNTRELKKAGFDVKLQVVSNKRAMEKALREHKWDLILSDNHMPCFDALQALELRNRLCKETIFIIVSEDISKTQVETAMTQGCNAYIPKEHVDRLGQCIAELLANNRQI